MILPYDIYTLPTGYTHTGLAQRGDLVVDLRDGLVRLQLLRPHVGGVVLRLLEELAQLRSGVQLNPATQEIGKYFSCVYKWRMIQISLRLVVGDGVHHCDGAAGVGDGLLHVV